MNTKYPDIDLNYELLKHEYEESMKKEKSRSRSKSKSPKRKSKSKSPKRKSKSPEKKSEQLSHILDDLDYLNNLWLLEEIANEEHKIVDDLLNQYFDEMFKQKSHKKDGKKKKSKRKI